MADTKSFLVERYLPGASASSFARLRERLATAFGPEAEVRYRGSILVPGDDACLCLFDGRSKEEVLAANRAAAMSVDRVVEIDLGFEPCVGSGEDQQAMADDVTHDSRRIP